MTDVPKDDLPGRTTPDGVSDQTVDALGKLSEALETCERARGHLYTFHQLTGSADIELGEAVTALREAGHDAIADRIEHELVGRNVLPGRWTFQIVEDYDDALLVPVPGAGAGGPGRAGRRRTPSVRGAAQAGRAHGRGTRSRRPAPVRVLGRLGWPATCGSPTRRMAAAFAQHAEDSAYNAHYDRPAVLEALGPVAGCAVLDAGCGPGFYAEALIEAGATVSGFDATEAMVALGPKIASACAAEIQRAFLGDALPYPDADASTGVSARWPSTTSPTVRLRTPNCIAGAPARRRAGDSSDPAARRRIGCARAGRTSTRCWRPMSGRVSSRSAGRPVLARAALTDHLRSARPARGSSSTCWTRAAAGRQHAGPVSG